MPSYRWCVNCNHEAMVRNSEDHLIALCMQTKSENYLSFVDVTDSCPWFEGNDPDEVYEDG